MTDYEKGWQAAVAEAAEWIYRNACKTKYLYNGGIYSAGMETDFKEYMKKRLEEQQ